MTNAGGQPALESLSQGMFRGLGLADREALRGALVHRRFEPGSQIIGAGSLPGWVYLVDEGRVRLFQCGLDRRELTLGVAGPGDLIGVAALFGSPRYAACAQAVCATTLCGAPGGEFLAVVERVPALMQHLVMHLAHEALQAESTLDSLAFGGARERLAATLLALDGESGLPVGRGERLLSVKVTHADLACRIGAARETVTRLLCALEDEGLLRRQGRRVVLCNLAALAAVAGLDEPPAATRPVPARLRDLVRR